MSYRIPDEPKPGALARMAVNPVWPLFAFMVGGTWLAWPWFVLNGFALGSPHRQRELALVVVGFLGSIGLTIALLALAASDVLVGVAISYAALVITVWKIGVSYVLHIWQGRSFSLYEYYGGQVDGRLPILFLLGGIFLRPKVLGLLGDNVLWKFVVS